MIKNLFFLLSATAVAFSAFVLCLFNYSPYLATNVELGYFYISFWLAFSGIFALIIFFLKTRKEKSEYANKYFWSSVRQGTFFSAALTTILLLIGMKLFDWWIGILAAVVIALLELFFQTKQKK